MRTHPKVYAETIPTPKFTRLGVRATFGFGLSSSRFDRLPATLLWAFVNVFVKRRTFIVLTEVGNDKRIAAVRRVPGWGVIQVNKGDGHDECAVAYRRRYWHPVWWHTHQVADTEPTTGPNTLRCVCVLLMHWRTGQTLLASGLHGAAHIEDGDGWSESRRDVAAAQETLDEWPEHLLGHARNPDVDHVAALADLNLNVRRRHWRELLGNAFQRAGLISVWHGRLPDEGSHVKGGWTRTRPAPDARLIDVGFTNLIILWFRVIGFNRSSDHAFVAGRARMKLVKSPKTWPTKVALRLEKWRAASAKQHAA